MDRLDTALAPAGTSILAVGFGTTVAMWAVGYVGRLPLILLPSPLLLILLLGCLLAGGAALGRYAHLGWLRGAAAGLLCGLLNLLVLGSFLSRGGAGVLPAPALWLPGFLLVAAALGAIGAAAGSRWLRREPPVADWSSVFVRVGIAAALLLLGVGGLVTSTGAGLAVVDWPNTFGYNMFLYPFSRMTGGIYYEHAHRLFGALVGLTSVVLAGVLQLREPRRWVRALGWTALVLVVVQGILGGLRVTGGFTLSSEPGAMRPSLSLALIHGVLGQVFFGCLVALGVVTSASWRARPAPPPPRRAAAGQRLGGGLLVSAVIGQLVLGATLRHFDRLLLVHVTFALAVVAPLALHVGFRAWALHPGQPVVQRLGLGLVAGTGCQLALGLAALAFRGATEADRAGRLAEVALSTAHQWFGAVLLALAVALGCWSFRGPEPPGR